MYGMFKILLYCIGLVYNYLFVYLFVCLFVCFIPVCGVNCHSRCQPNIPNLCGVNERLMAEALKDVDEVKKKRLVSYS